MVKNTNSLCTSKALHKQIRTKIIKVKKLVLDLIKLTICCHLLYSNTYTLSHVQITCWLHVVTEMPNKAFCVSFLRKEKWLEHCTFLLMNSTDIQSHKHQQPIIIVLLATNTKHRLYTRSRMNLHAHHIYIVYEKIGLLAVPTYHLCHPTQIMLTNRHVTKSLFIISNQKNCAALSWLVGLAWYDLIWSAVAGTALKSSVIHPPLISLTLHANAYKVEESKLKELFHDFGSSSTVSGLNSNRHWLCTLLLCTVYLS